MTHLLRLLTIVIACATPLAVAADAADATFLRLDHYNPVILNEHAVRKASEGDLGTAAILLERAVQIAPHDVRIRHNLATLRAWQAGQPAPELPVEEMQTPASTGAGNEIAVLPPFPLWPKK